MKVEDVLLGMTDESLFFILFISSSDITTPRRFRGLQR